MNPQEIIEQAAANWHSAAEEVGQKIVDLGADAIRRLVEDATTDGQAQLKSSQKKLVEWTAALAEGTINREEYIHLIKSRVSLLKFHTLTEAGIAQARIELFRKALINLITNTAIKAIT